MTTKPAVKRVGSLYVIIGAMFSGKTDALIEYVEKLKKKGKHYKTYKPKRDNRYAQNKIVAHNKKSIDAERVMHVDEIVSDCHSLRKKHKIVIDEGMIYKGNVLQAVNAIRLMGHDVVITGLMVKHDNTPWKPFSDLASYATRIKLCLATCRYCKSKTATRQIRLVEDESDVVIGGANSYAATCDTCFIARC